MIDFVKYVVSELKSDRLSKEDALGLITEFSRRVPPTGSAAIHPLLHTNTSDLTQQSYRASFTGDEFFLRDHRIRGQKILPGVAYLEMARAAACLAMPEQNASAGFELRNVAWAHPVVFPRHRDLTVALFHAEQPGRGIELEVFSSEEVVHFQGCAVFGELSAPARHELPVLAARMSRGRMEAQALYTKIAGMGIELGPAHQGVKVVHHGEHEMLVEIVLPQMLEDTAGQFMLHPSVLDSAIQAGMALVMERNGGTSEPPIPFALESLRVFGNCDKRMFAWVRHADGGRADARLVKLDIDLCDEVGNVRAQMLGFSARVMGAETAAAPRDRACLYAAPSWQRADLSGPTGDGQFHERYVWLCSMPSLDIQCVTIDPQAQGDIGRRYTRALIACVEQIQSILEHKPHEPVLVQLVIPNDADHLAFTGLSALLATMTQENPKLVGQLLMVDADIDAGTLRDVLDCEARQEPEPLVRYENAVRYLRHFDALDKPSAGAQTALKSDGVYVITGGLGALGLLFAKEILARTSEANIILTGRSRISEAQQRIIDGLNGAGAARIHYRPMDLCVGEDVDHAIVTITQQFGRISGIVHSAGMVQDNFIAKKSAAEIGHVCAPKVTGTVNLDHATRELDLDFLVLFSSAAAAFGNAGQADYAAANGFMDGFAAYRNRLSANGARSGTAVSINWPLWEEGGMAPDPASIAMLERTTGMTPMSTSNGMQAFHRSLELGLDQLLVVEGDLGRLRSALLGSRPLAAHAAPAVVGLAFDADSVFEQTREFLRKQFAQVLKLAPQKIDPQARLERYGIDSILAMDLTNQLEITFGSLPKTLFFEHHTIVELTGYFVHTHAARLAALFSAAAAPVAKAQAAPEAVNAAFPAPVARRHLRRAAAETPSQSQSEPIAIVGLSGRYPEAPDLATFWSNLRDGKDCIVEVPADRWDWREYYSDDRSSEGRHYSKWGGFISGVDEFDPLFFGIAPVGCELIDPQERLFLQHAWMALEDAGYTRDSLQVAHAAGQAGQVGVYVGVMYGEYQLFGAEASLQGKRMGIPLSYASIANRVSYILNLHGPSMTLDSMCSSSLTAIHLACQDLKQGRTDLAIAGGVNVTIHPNKYLILSAGQFISSDGHCQSFGEGGDGYIPGEGVGAVMLKRLSDAERDGNHIYGVIKGSALNHGGRTNGYSVPNPKSQAAVIDLALQEYGIDARHVSYIEAHGTGTRLGDPIEIAALSQVFKKYTQEKQFCAVGSAKSNIGHCESAAGIAGLTKVLLQMKNRMIVPSLHSAALNPHIDFEASPFVVNQALRAWDQPLVDGKPVPRIAGISSFGAGGSNAHLIVQEYEAPAASSSHAEGSECLITLSARTPAQLKRKAADLLAFVQQPDNALDLEALAHTLQVGREAMNVRLAFVVASIAQLEVKLAAFGRDEQGVEQSFQGVLDHDRDGMSVLADDDDMMEAVDKWIARKKLAKLADLWVRGMELDWKKLYAGRRVPLVSLPTYPFARDRYWFEGSAGQVGLASAGTPMLHPMVHRNTSDFFQQSYAASFSGDELFLADHQIGHGDSKQKILPGVAYLEMARAAVELALPSAGRRLEIRNVAWAQPVIVGGNTEVTIALASDGERIVDFDVRSGQTGHEPVIHCQGQVELSDAAEPARIDIAALKARMSGGVIGAEHLYSTFGAMGMHYGRSFRCVASIYQGERQLLAELAMPPAGDDDKLVLPPGLLDSALQAAIGLAGDITGLSRQPSVPFALDSIVLLKPCVARMFAWVRHAPEAHSGSGFVKVNIDLCDVDGNVCVRLAGLSSRTLEERSDDIGLLLARPVWETAPAGAAAAAYPRHLVLLCGLPQIGLQQLSSEIDGVEVKRIDSAAGEGIEQRYRAAALAGLDDLRALLKGASHEKTLFQLVVEDEGETALMAGLSGMIDTARLENPNLVGQLVLTDAGVSAAGLAMQLRDSAAQVGDVLSRHANGACSVSRWQPLASEDAAPTAFKNDGVYMITGGMGGLGMLFAREVLATTASATVILTGRSPADAVIDAKLAAIANDLKVAAGRLVYRQLDLNQLDQVEALVTSLLDQFGTLHGVIHSAGMNSDNFIINKTAKEMTSVLAPKVAGTVNLDLATRALKLDFLVLFSSLSSAIGNIGQADYAAANGFLDQFAVWRSSLVQQGSRHGTTLSINWPLWQEGGMQIDAATLELMAATSGMQPLRTESAMRAFRRSLAMGISRVLVIEGNLAKMRRALNKRHVESLPAVAANVDTTGLMAQAQAYLVTQFGEMLRIPAHEVDVRAPLEKYGMDSVLAMKLTSQMERTFGSLPKTLLFEHQTIASLAGYLVKAFPAHLGKQPNSDIAPASVAVGTLPGLRGRKMQVAHSAGANRDVAIIGVGGRYPMAKDLGEFWENLKNGRDCVTEIPGERWDHTPFFDAARNQPGKTYSKWGGFIEGVDQFDALFFSISPKEAELIDPQERLFLETVWETIEDAGYSKEAIARNRVGVYVGVMWGQYELYGAASNGAGVPSSSFASIANRVSYFFNFQGPSLALDTMCSSSLTAIHLAGEAVRTGQVDIAIAGGVNVSIHPSKYLSLSQGNFASTDGRCRSFGAGGDGYVPGEGVGAVVLKPLDLALRDGDQVYGVIKASSINHGGKTNGYTVPNPLAQSDLISAVLDKAGLDPASIDYVETHGTGTALGDPIEIAGLVKGFEGAAKHGRARAAASRPIGSVKSNIGHLESAAGIAALTKVLLQFKHQQLVPSLHADVPNPNIDFDRSPFHVQTALQAWKRPEGRARLAAISSFGAGGSNAHVIIEECVDLRQPPSTDGAQHAFLLSARNRTQLLSYAERIMAMLAPEVPMADIAYTSQVGRTPMQERLVVIAADITELKLALRRWCAGEVAGNVYEGSTKGAHSVGAAVSDNGDLVRLAKLWIGGAEIEWQSLWRTQRGRRVSLPTYPFAKERFWIDAGHGMRTIAAAPKGNQLLYYRTEWRNGALASTAQNAIEGPMLVIGANDALLAQLRNVAELVAVGHGADLASVMAKLDKLPRSIVLCAGDAGDTQQDLDHGVFALHTLCRALMQQKPAAQPRIICLRQGEAPLHSALAGYFKTLVLENPAFSWKLLSIEETDAASAVVAELRDAAWRNGEVRYRQHTRQIREMAAFTPRSRANAGIAVKQNGVYIVTGGLGGLGFIFSQYLARQYGARLVLTGRSAPDEAKIAALKALGGDAIYFQGDVSERGQADALLQAAKSAFSQINGIIHSAGINRDAFILNKSREDMASVLATKVSGTINLDLATADENLDLFVLFSSLAGVLGNVGQSDYAFANNFMDAYAEQRQTKGGAGQSLSINWPFWAQGGMHISPADLEQLAQRSGIHALPTEDGIRFWEQLVGSGETQGIALFGDAAMIDAYLARPSAPAPQVATREITAPGPLFDATANYLKGLLSEQIKLAVERIDSDERFEAFGVDSMMISRINADMERDLGALPKTLFYEYTTIAELATYLVGHSQSALVRKLDVQAPAEKVLAVAPTVALPPVRPTQSNAPIAIIGVHGQFPGSTTLDQYWQNLREGRDLISPVPAGRWDMDAFFDADPANASKGKIYCKWGGFLDDADKFDAAFFGITPEDARLIDPQERMFIQSVWSAVEDAGYTRDSLKKRHPKAKSADVGVFVGVTTNSYHLLTPQEWERGNMVTPGAMPWSIANRVSYFFDFQGPSMPVDTACSSSLVALHLACESIRRNECQVAVAGGVNLYLHPAKYQSLCGKRMLAVDGKCRSFGTGDDGFIPGEGIASFVLKPLTDAIADGDHVYGVIEASAVSHGGRANGYSAPNPQAQASLMEQAMSQAGIGADAITYVEGHGTGTQMGDSLEVLSLTQAFRKHTQEKGYCSLGSVKANVGHSESAAGMAGVAKILMQFKHRAIAPTIHSSAANPDIDFAGSPFYLQSALCAWDAPEGRPRRAMINSFGAGGVNACMILHEFEAPSVQATAGQSVLVILSARDKARLKESAIALRAQVSSETDMVRLAYTLQVGREAMPERLAIVANSEQQLTLALSAYLEGGVPASVILGRVEPQGRAKAPRQSQRDRAAALFGSGDLAALAQMWMEGQPIEWDSLYGTQKISKLPLPTYPFAKERHWVSDAPAQTKHAARAEPAATKLHPLVCNNASTLREVRFASTLSGSEYYGRDHQVGSEMFFPGAGFLEIACASGTIAGEEAVTRIEDIVWNQPLRLSGGLHRVQTFLKSNGGAAEFVVVSYDDEQETVVHSEGRVFYGAGGRRDEQRQAYSIQELKSKAERTVQGADCYRQLAAFGLNYGPCFQTIEQMHVGQGFVLSRLVLAQELLDSFEQYILHPCLVDGALQSVIGIATGGEEHTPYLPFALDEVAILRPMRETCYAYVEAAASNGAGGDIKQFNIAILSESGDVLVRLNNFYVRALRSARPVRHASADSLLLSE